jgi:hypothetical protein
MRKMMFGMGCSFALLALATFNAPVARAHVLITDTAKQVGAILHVQPDDDPIAGESSNLFFDIQSEALATGNYTAILTIRDDKGQRSDVPAKIAGNTITAVYTFASQGVYRMELVTKTNDTKGTGRTFDYVQRVSRGVEASPLQQPQYDWAELLMVGAVVAAIVLVILAVNNRKAIATSSR